MEVRLPQVPSTQGLRRALRRQPLAATLAAVLAAAGVLPASPIRADEPEARAAPARHWSAPRQLADEQFQYHYVLHTRDLTLDHAGNALAQWYTLGYDDQDGPTHTAYHRAGSSSWTLADSPAMLQNFPNATTQPTRFSYDGASAWTGDGRESSIYLARFDAATRSWRPLETLTTPLWPVDVRTVVGASGNLALVWATGEPLIEPPPAGTPALYGRCRTPADGRWSGDVPVTGVLRADGDDFRLLGVLPLWNERVLVVWSANTPAGARVATAVWRPPCGGAGGVECYGATRLLPGRVTAVAFNRSGQGAALIENDGGAGLQALLYEPARGWSAPRLLATGPVERESSQVVVNELGHLMIGWLAPASGDAAAPSRYVTGAVWGDWSGVRQADTAGHKPLVALDNLRGDALAVWQGPPLPDSYYSLAPHDLFASRWVRATGEWTRPVAISRHVTTGASVGVYTSQEPRLAMTDDGRAAVLWVNNVPRHYDPSAPEVFPYGSPWVVTYE